MIYTVKFRPLSLKSKLCYILEGYLSVASAQNTIWSIYKLIIDISTIFIAFYSRFLYIMSHDFPECIL